VVENVICVREQRSISINRAVIKTQQLPSNIVLAVVFCHSNPSSNHVMRKSNI